jgi:SAM-dependent methyltransferase
MFANYDESTYGEQIAEVYDEWYSQIEEAALPLLVVLAQGGRALELGIGTGRIALPLLERGVEVHGIDASPAMVARLREKTGGEKIPVSSGNFADMPVEGKFDLIYVLFNTFFGLLSQDEQVRCFENVARHLHPNGVFLIEAFVPDMGRYVDRQTLRVVDMSDGKMRIDASLLDPLLQQVTSQQFFLSAEEMRLYPVKLRYAWPSELDLMARLAGMRLSQRWGGWEKESFTASSGKHISIYSLSNEG